MEQGNFRFGPPWKSGSRTSMRGGGTPVTKLRNTTEFETIVLESPMAVENVRSDCAGGMVMMLDEFNSLHTAHIYDTLYEYSAKKEKPTI